MCTNQLDKPNKGILSLKLGLRPKVLYKIYRDILDSNSDRNQLFTVNTCQSFFWGTEFKYLWSYKGKNSWSCDLVLIFFNDLTNYKNTQMWKVCVVQYAFHVKFLRLDRRYFSHSIKKLLRICCVPVAIEGLGGNIQKTFFLFHKSSMISFIRGR